MIDIADSIEQGHNTGTVLDNHGINSPGEREPLEATITRMKEFHQADRNHVWAYYLRNMTRPAAIAQRKVDAIIGNPPWLKFSDSAAIIREELRGMSEMRYQIWAGGKQAPHQDIAALFFCRTAELYLDAEGTIGMVMPTAYSGQDNTPNSEPVNTRRNSRAGRREFPSQ